MVERVTKFRVHEAEEEHASNDGGDGRPAKRHAQLLGRQQADGRKRAAQGCGCGVRAMRPWMRHVRVSVTVVLVQRCTSAHGATCIAKEDYVVIRKKTLSKDEKKDLKSLLDVCTAFGVSFADYNSKASDSASSLNLNLTLL